MDYQSSIFRQVMSQQQTPPPSPQQQQHNSNNINNNNNNTNSGYLYTGYPQQPQQTTQPLYNSNPYPYGGARGGGLINNNYFSSPPPLPSVTPPTPLSPMTQANQTYNSNYSNNNNHNNNNSNNNNNYSYHPLHYQQPQLQKTTQPQVLPPQTRPQSYYPLSPNPPNYYSPPPIVTPPVTPNVSSPKANSFSSIVKEINHNNNSSNNNSNSNKNNGNYVGPSYYTPSYSQNTSSSSSFTSTTSASTSFNNNRYPMGFSGFNSTTTTNSTSQTINNSNSGGISFKNNNNSFDNNNSNNKTVQSPSHNNNSNNINKSSITFTNVNSGNGNTMPKPEAHSNPFLESKKSTTTTATTTATTGTAVDLSNKKDESSNNYSTVTTTSSNIPHNIDSNSNNKTPHSNHRRFNSASSLNIESGSDSSITNSNSTSNSNLNQQQVAPSQLKSKFLKVVSDVKKGLPQVSDSFINQYNNLSLSLSNGGISRPPNKRSESPNNIDPSSPPQYMPLSSSSSSSSSPPIIVNNNSNIKLTKPMNKPPPPSQSLNNQLSFYSYYGGYDDDDDINNNNNINSDSDSEIDNINRIVKSSRVDNNNNNNNSSPPTSVDSILKTSSEAITIPLRAEPKSPPPPQQQQTQPILQKASSTTLIDTSTTSTTSNQFKSSMLNQLKNNQQYQQQTVNNTTTTTTVRQRPVSLQLNSYPNIDDISTQSLSPPLNSNGADYPNLASSSGSKAIKEDITLQRFKPLPPRPNPSSGSYGSTPPSNPPSLDSSSSPIFHQFNTNNSSNNSNNNGLKGLFSILTSSKPLGSSDIDDDFIEISGPKGASSDRYKEDFSQYLSEHGDKSKIYQHIQWHLDQNIVNIETIKLLGCNYGFPEQCRATSWQLLLGYLPINTTQRTSVLLHKRSQYRDLVKKHLPGQDKQLTFIFRSTNISTPPPLNELSWDDGNDGNSYYQQFNQQINQHFKNHSSKFISSMVNMVNNKAKNYEDMVAQIHVDVIRTRPEGFQALFELPELEKMLERILMIWSIENSDISYFQGLNDLVCPFLLVFLEHEINQLNNSNSTSYPSVNASDDNGSWSAKLEKLMGEGQIIKELKECGQAEVVLSRVEADVYWCITLLMNSVKNYSIGTGCGLPAEGMMKRLEALVKESNDRLYKHLKNLDIDFSHFSFRWMVCFLTRDLNLELGFKLWDNYLCDKENQGFSLLHICFCSAILSQWTDILLEKDFMDLVQYLQKPPSLKWTEKDLELIFRKSYLLKEKYKNILH